MHGVARRKSDPGGNTSSNSKVKPASTLHQETEGGYLQGWQGVAKVEGTGWPFWGLKTPESPSGDTGTANIRSSLCARKLMRSVTCTSCLSAKKKGVRQLLCMDTQGGLVQSP